MMCGLLCFSVCCSSKGVNQISLGHRAMGHFEQKLRGDAASQFRFPEQSSPGANKKIISGCVNLLAER